MFVVTNALNQLIRLWTTTTIASK